MVLRSIDLENVVGQISDFEEHLDARVSSFVAFNIRGVIKTRGRRLAESQSLSLTQISDISKKENAKRESLRKMKTKKNMKRRDKSL